MSIKISNTTVIDNSKRAFLDKINIGSYTTAELQSGSYNGLTVGSFTFCETEQKIVYWNGSSWVI